MQTTSELRGCWIYRSFLVGYGSVGSDLGKKYWSLSLKLSYLVILVNLWVPGTNTSSLLYGMLRWKYNKSATNVLEIQEIDLILIRQEKNAWKATVNYIKRCQQLSAYSAFFASVLNRCIFKNKSCTKTVVSDSTDSFA